MKEKHKNPEETFKPTLNKNTDRLLESRQKRLIEKSQMATNSQSKKSELKWTDKVLLGKFHKEFEQAVKKTLQLSQSKQEVPSVNKDLAQTSHIED